MALHGEAEATQKQGLTKRIDDITQALTQTPNGLTLKQLDDMFGPGTYAAMGAM